MIRRISISLFNKRTNLQAGLRLLEFDHHFPEPPTGPRKATRISLTSDIQALLSRLSAATSKPETAIIEAALQRVSEAYLLNHSQRTTQQ
jgi:hypothetical protein